MAERLSFDTSYLIDAQRELSRPGLERPALDFLRERSESIFCLSAMVVGEFAEGIPDRRDSRLTRILRSAQVLAIDVEVALVYATATRRLRIQGKLIGSNDLWIAATALRHDIPLVTRNREHFRRVEGLKVLGY